MQSNKFPKINVVIGTRAQLIKTAPVMRLLQDKKIDYRFIYTAQHKVTIDEVRENFGLKKPDYVLMDWKEEAKTMKLFIGKWFAQAMIKLFTKAKEIIPSRGGVVITHGDTVSAVWGAILGKLTGNKVMHLESGLRSYNIFKPFPEEISRLLTFAFTDIYVCPNSWAMNNLKNYRGVKINTKQNTQFDSLQFALKNMSKIRYKTLKEKYVVASIHRYEHIFKKDKFVEVIDVVNKISEKFKCVFVLHPATVKQLQELNLKKKLSKNVVFEDRLPFFEFIKLIYNSEFVITDGGSNQEELSYMGKPTLILRDVTERTEGLGENAVLAKFDHSVIADFLKNYKKYRRPQKKQKVSPSEMIVNWLVKNKYAN